MSIIIAGHTGIGKTFLSRQYPDKVFDLVCVPYKYDMELDPSYTEASKANLDKELSMDWPDNYVAKIKEVHGSYDFIMIAPDLMTLDLLRRSGIPYILAYPEHHCKEEYRLRYLRRGNVDRFFDVFIDGWDRFLRAYDETYCTARILLGPGEYLTLDKLREATALLPNSRLDINALFSISSEELSGNFDSVLLKVDLGYSPILIKTDNQRDLLLFGWDDYMKRFGCLLTQEELDQIHKLCKHSEVDVL
jgi:hypothetical protein